jgi:hypothetical protein
VAPPDANGRGPVRQAKKASGAPGVGLAGTIWAYRSVVPDIDLQASYAYIEGMTDRQIQYTLRRIPPRVDRELRRRADAQRQSLNDVAVQALECGLGLADQPVRYHDLDDLAGTWVDDPEFDDAIAQIDKVDPELWR